MNAECSANDGDAFSSDGDAEYFMRFSGPTQAISIVLATDPIPGTARGIPVVVACPFTIIGPGGSLLSLDGFRLECRDESFLVGEEKPARFRHLRRSCVIVRH
ncbi:hypothetical protein MACH17_24270 [Phaeobacter inhibens]|nr:hypothetical protein MACH17_24270 [Phaeobacter inhibens]